MATGKARIVNKSEARRKENMRISSTVDRANNKRKNKKAAKAIEQRERQKSAGITRVGGSPKTHTTPTPISTGKPVITGEPAPYNPPGQSRFETMVHKQSAKGYSVTNGYQMSDTSRGFYEKTHNVAETIRTGVQTKRFSQIPGSQVLQYPVRSTANLIDMSGMVPGGVETITRNPGVIAPALTIGAYQATAGTARAFKEDPLQTSSDILTGALLTGGAMKAAPKLAGGIGSGVKAVSSKAATSAKPVVSDLIAPAKPVTNRLLFDAEILKIKAQQTGRTVKQNANNKLFDLEMRRLEFLRDEGGQVQLMRPIQKQQYRQVHVTRQLTRQQSAIVPRSHLKIRRMQVPQVQTGLGLTSFMVGVPGFVTSSIQTQIQTQTQIQKQTQTQAQIQKQIEIPDQIQIQKQIQSMGKSLKQQPKNVYKTGMPGMPKMPKMPAFSLLPEKKSRSSKKSRKGKTDWKYDRKTNDWKFPLKDLKIKI